jgi:hypothetical protein
MPILSKNGRSIPKGRAKARKDAKLKPKWMKEAKAERYTRRSKARRATSGTTKRKKG